MKTHLMYPDRDFNPEAAPPAQAQALIQDLSLDTLIETMAAGDNFLQGVAKAGLLQSLVGVEEIRYRQEILKDCLRHPEVLHEVYRLALQAEEGQTKFWLGGGSRYPAYVLHNAIERMEALLVPLKGLRSLAERQRGKFQSAGLQGFFQMLEDELDSGYFDEVHETLKTLKFRQGLLLAARLDAGSKMRDYVLCLPHPRKVSWFRRLFPKRPRQFTFYIDPRDESGGKALSELRDRGLNVVADALMQSTDHVRAFMGSLRTELAFYLGCLNLQQRLGDLKAPVCFPVARPAEPCFLETDGAYDVCLALARKRSLVGNRLHAGERPLVLITGANQGGKTAFLRALGLAQVMMQCGLFVPAEAFEANLCRGLFTHFKREEDASMRSGKFAEELERMSAIVDRLGRGSLVLFNESFAATNEREGSEIARQIVQALLEKGIKVAFVTHLYAFAHGVFECMGDSAAFLRALPPRNGERTYRLDPGEPMATNAGEDLFQQVFSETGMAGAGERS
jgi:hypothetical protein